jgi:hypothetical protein
MKHAVWKLSMGTHAGGGEFSTLGKVKKCLREKERVVVWQPTLPKAGRGLPQGVAFVEVAKDDAYFYLCHGNKEPGIMLLGQFTGPAEPVSSPEWRDDWVGRPYRTVKQAIITKKYDGENHWWTPNNNSTFIKIPEDHLEIFEAVILQPYFNLTLADLD